MKLFEFEKLDGDNKLFCDNCNEKTDTLKGQKIQKLPPILQIDLLRFDFDYNTFQRVKVNDRFEFPLELDVSAHLDPEAFEDPENTLYELKSIIIHRGGAHGGHYHAYINDELKEGNWYLEMPKEFEKDPRVTEKKAYNPKEYMTEQ
jgi:ubiquitin carboxyl-terminal hydrolase 40